MSVTAFGTGSDSTVKLWSQRLYYDFQTDQQLLGQLVKAGVVRQQEELSRDAGDRVRVSFANRLVTQGLIGMETGTGNEQAINYATDDLLINQLRVIVSIPAAYTIDAQRVLYNLPEDSYRLTSEWMQVRGALGALNQLAGNSANTLTFDGQNYVGGSRISLTGLNAATAPSTTSGCTRVFRPNGWTTDQAVGADPTATAKLSDVFALETIAQTSKPYIRPLAEGDLIKFHYYVHIQPYMDLQNDTSGPYLNRAPIAQVIGNKLCEFGGRLEQLIPSQATRLVEGVTTILQRSTAKWLEALSTLMGGDIVCSA